MSTTFCITYGNLDYLIDLLDDEYIDYDMYGPYLTVDSIDADRVQNLLDINGFDYTTD